jgi:aminoglycoside phosphotransferase (APT) family kinase protein
VLDHHWRICSSELSYLSVGFGDHHWQANTATGRYFITVRDLRLDDRADNRAQVMLLLEQTFQAVRQLRDLADLKFMVAALPTISGSMVVPLGDNFALSVYDWLDVQPAPDVDGVIATELVARLHRASREHRVPAVVEDFRIPHRSALEASLADLDKPWRGGPFGEQARAEVVAHQADIQSALEHYDALVAAAVTSSRDWCLTHGEPSGANLVQDQSGAYYLVDWESARVAPPERDLVDLASSDKALDHYRLLSESPPARADLLRLYRLQYALAETSVYLLQFRARHTADHNMVESWQNFLTFLPGRQASSF